MTDLHTQFETAQALSKNLPSKPDNPTLLKLYGLYKQSTEGDNTQAKPGFSDLVARAKWDAWHKHQGLSTAQAQQAYIDLVSSLR